VAIDATDLDGGTRLIIEYARAVTVLSEMAIDAVHAFFKMDVLQVDGLLKLVRVVSRDDAVGGVQQIAFAVLFIDVFEHPAMAVRIGTLHVR